MLLFSIIIASLFSATFSHPTYQRRTTACNGHSQLCDRSYGNITYLTTHNSFAISKNPLDLGRNQEIDLLEQLNLGVRALQAQSHMKDGVLHFCHTSCTLFDGGTVLSYLQKVKSFLEANPDEVISLIFTNPDSASPKAIWDPIFQQSGVAQMAYVPPHLPMKASEWPTLREMIGIGKRVVVFLDYGAKPAEVPYILPEFDHIWEPPFSETDPNFPCRVDRISGPLSSQDHMFMINHNLNYQVFSKRSPNPMPTPAPGWWDNLTGVVGAGISHAASGIGKGVSHATRVVDAVTSAIAQIPDELSGVLVPDYIKAPKTNSIVSIVANSDGCAAYSGGKATNFVMLDFVNIGEGIKAVSRLNGLS